MSNSSRRKWITGGIVATAGASGLALAARIADRYRLIPPDAGSLYGTGESLTYAAQRLITRNSLAREFPRHQMSATPFPNGKPPEDDVFKRHQAHGFADWRLVINGMVARPAPFSLADLRSYPSRSQITQLICEEGWSYVAEWTGVPLSHVLHVVGIHPEARYVIYSSHDDWTDSIDMADALHPQTLLTLSMNGGDLPVSFGGPLRMRVPRQLGYKSVKYVNRLTVTDNLKDFKPSQYSWFAGI